MAQYEADKIIQLLQFCSWKARTEMNHTGLQELTSRLEPLPGGEPGPNEKYLVDLYSDAKTALKKDTFITKRESYIQLLLNYSGYQDWDNWKSLQRTAGEYLPAQHLKTAEDGTLRIAVAMPEKLEKLLLPVLSHVKRDCPELCFPVFKETAEKASSPWLAVQLEENSLVICALPLSWKDQPGKLKDPSWTELIQSGRFIPVWINPESLSIWDTTPPFLPALNQSKVIGGMPGILTTLLFIQELLQEMLDPEGASADETPLRLPVGVQNFHDNSNGFFNKGHVNQNNTFQTVHTERYFAKE